MEWSPFITVVLSSTVLGSIIAALVTARTNLKNSREQRSSEERKLYFEKAFESLVVYDKYITIQKQKHQSIASACRQFRDEVTQSGDKQSAGTKNLNRVKQAVDLPNSELTNEHLSVFLDLKSCMPDNLENTQEDYNAAIVLYNDMLRKIVNAEKIQLSQMIEVVNQLGETSELFQQAQQDYISNFHSAFRQSYITTPS